MIQKISFIILAALSIYQRALAGDEDEKGHGCKNHVEMVSVYKGPLKDELAFKPERSFYQGSYHQDPTFVYIDKAQLTLNVQGDDD